MKRRHVSEVQLQEPHLIEWLGETDFVVRPPHYGETAEFEDLPSAYRAAIDTLAERRRRISKKIRQLDSRQRHYFKRLSTIQDARP